MISSARENDHAAIGRSSAGDLTGAGHSPEKSFSGQSAAKLPEQQGGMSHSMGVGAQLGL